MSVIGESLTHMDLYTNNILELASTIPITTRLMNPDVTITKRTAICGSSTELRKNLKTFLDTGTFLIKDPFTRYKYFEPAQKVPYRHDSVLLILDASIDALQKVSSLKTKSN